ncbi:NAD(P)/FAD-dependent oxidoreductase [uncultured Gimesia sp.]|uniref:phytoene desaturase family protein n=1 Tax=uncultured Gimesia sp. TaxID=1678688 RepID=UPI0030DBD4CB|tara:strand:+ start:11739 stop:13289 length:1551 start_codon:yes stop_codon:yes gene_type:complete
MTTTQAAWDEVVIGSGMGGMTAAAAISRLGHRVLLLEQYDSLGGQTHSFSRDGFSWDAGLHYLGDLGQDQREKAILDWLTDTPIELATIGAIYDTLHIGNAPTIQLTRPTESQKLDLKERFPDEGDAIKAWYNAIHEGREALTTIIQARSMPAVFGTAMKWWRRRTIKRWCERTTAEVANDLTDNPELAAVFSAQWGTFGGRPSTASFALHAAVIGSYLSSGGFYPAGGGSTIAEHLLATITSAGGEARAGVTVESLRMENGRVVGVTTSDGEEIDADKVISDIGARETVDRLLPKDHGHQEWVDQIRSLGSNICHFSLFLGFSGDVEAAGATKSNHWLYPTGEIDAVWTDVSNAVPPAMFVSFASLKDPAHDPGPDQKHTGEFIAWADWSTVARWAGLPPEQRGDDYIDFKNQVEAALFEQFKKYFPKLAELVVFREVATPLATASITGHTKGSFYGLDVTPQRVLSNALRMKTPIKGLYLTGQDVVSPGIPGALWGGLLCATSIDPKMIKHLGG